MKNSWSFLGVVVGVCRLLWADACPPETQLVEHKSNEIFGQYCAIRVLKCPRDLDAEFFEQPGKPGCFVAHGPVLMNYPSGIKTFVEYQKGYMHGVAKAWNAQNQKISEEHYAKGKRHGRSDAWFSNGKPLRQESFVNGIRVGERIEWHVNGPKKMRVEYKAGKRHGVYEEWYPNGQRRVTTVYKDGFWNGQYFEWYSNGKLFSQNKYAMGVSSKAEAKATQDCSGFLSTHKRELAAVELAEQCLKADFDGNGYVDFVYEGNIVLTSATGIRKVVPFPERNFEIYPVTMADGLFNEPVTPRPGLVKWGSDTVRTKIYLWDFDTDEFVATLYEVGR